MTARAHRRVAPRRAGRTTGRGNGAVPDPARRIDLRLDDEIAGHLPGDTDEDLADFIAASHHAAYTVSHDAAPTSTDAEDRRPPRPRRWAT